MIILTIFIIACDADENNEVNNNTKENSNLEEITFKRLLEKVITGKLIC